MSFEEDLRTGSCQPDKTGKSRFGEKARVGHENCAVMISAEEDLVIFTSCLVQKTVGNIVEGVSICPEARDGIGEHFWDWVWLNEVTRAVPHVVNRIIDENIIIGDAALEN